MRVCVWGLSGGLVSRILLSHLKTYRKACRDRAEDVDRRDVEEGLGELRAPSGCRGGILRVRKRKSQE